MAVRREVRQPGPADAERIDSAAGASRAISITLLPGRSLLAAVSEELQAAGLCGAGVQFHNVRFRPFRYVIPAFSADPAHVAYYSATHAPEGEVEVDYATLTYGCKDGEPFLHCHALWRDAGGRPRGGHLLPSEAFVSAPAPATAFGTTQVAMVSRFDSETNFTLFRPEAASTAPVGTAADCILARIKPNVDLVEGIEAVCRQHGVREAILRSGVGSIIGAEFADGRCIEEHPTEIVVLEGRVTTSADGAPRAELAIGLIDTAGTVYEGRPLRGRNPVLICFELVLERVA